MERGETGQTSHIIPDDQKDCDMKQVIAVVFSVSISLFLTSCMVGPDYKKPELPAKKDWQSQSMTESPGKVIEMDWWKEFNDPQLDELVGSAIEQSYDLKILFDKLAAAGALTKKTRADLYPSADLTASGEFTRSETDGAAKNLDIRAGVTWEIDLWGKKRREVAARKAEQQSLEAEYRAGYLKLVTEVGTNYFLIRQLDKQTEMATKHLQDNRMILKIYERQHAEGIVAEQRVDRQEAEVFEIQRDMEEMKRRRKIAENQINTLLGKPVGSVVVPYDGKSQIVRPIDIPVGLPSTLLERRPDIIAAEFLVLKAVNLEGAAEAAKLPSFSLTAKGGLIATAFSSLLSGGIVGITPQLMLPIFDAGKRQAEVEMRKAEVRIASSKYAKVVLTAFEEVENSLVNLDSRQKQYLYLEKRIKSLKKVRRQTRKKLELGLASQLEVLEIEKELYNAEKAMPLLKRYLLDDTVTLYKSLGGGWPPMKVQ